MADFSKHDLFLSELNSLETQVAGLADRFKEAALKRKELENQLSTLKSENDYLRMQLEQAQRDNDELRKKLAELKASALMSGTEKDAVRQKIQEVINRINSHLGVA